MKTIVGERVKRRLGELGMNQATLARACGRSPSLISKILKGERGGDGPTISAIAKALGTTAEWLTGQSRATRQIRHGGRHSQTLRDVIGFSKICASRFVEAEDLAKSIFSEGRGLMPLTYFTKHGKDHCKMVEKYLEHIIWGGRESTIHDFVPTPEEAMYLLSAAWLHDIGMMYGIFDGEDPSDLKDMKKVRKLREKHEFRTSRYVHEKWSENCNWSEDEKTWLSNICVYHRRRHPIGTFEPFKIKGRFSEGYVRLGILAALLRLADACHVDQTRAPGPLMALYMSLGMPQEAIEHWEHARLVTEVEFDHTSKRIVLTGHCPPKLNFNLGVFDLREVVEIIQKDVEEELRSVQQVLLPWSNTNFLEVRHRIHYVEALDFKKEKQCLALWPYLLNKLSSSTERTAALVMVLLFAAEEGEKSNNLGEAWHEEVTNIIDKVQNSYPLDFMVRNLCRGVKERLSEVPDDAKSAEVFTIYLEDFLEKVNENCRKMAESARILVGSDDVLVVYGYSTNIAKFLQNVRGQFNNSLYIVDCYKPIGIHLGPDENERILRIANELGLAEVRFLPVAAVAQAFADLKRRNLRCKVLLGTHGILKSRDFLCKVGSYALALTANHFDVEVVAFADEKKLLINGESDEEVAHPEKLFSAKDCKWHATIPDTMCLSAAMDLVPKELVNLVVTEKGVFSTKDWIPGKKVLNKTRERNEG